MTSVWTQMALSTVIVSILVMRWEQMACLVLVSNWSSVLPGIVLSINYTLTILLHLRVSTYLFWVICTYKCRLHWCLLVMQSKSMFATDIDECRSEDDNNCSEVDINSQCMNTEGNYTCVCKSGYTNDGYTHCTSMYKFSAWYFFVTHTKFECGNFSNTTVKRQFLILFLIPADIDTRYWRMY